MIKNLYRGKCKLTGEWRYGFYVINNFGEPLILSGKESYGFFEHSKVIPESVSQYTGVKDKNKKKIFGNDRVKIIWTAELGITELGCEAIGTVKYMADGITAAWFVLFDKKYTRNVNCEMSYEEKWMELVQADEEMTVSFEILEV